MNGEPRFEQSPAVLQRRIHDEVIVTAPGDSDLLRLSGTAAVCWLLLSDARTVRELVGELAGIYRVGASEIADDTRALVDSLTDRGLLQVVAAKRSHE